MKKTPAFVLVLASAALVGCGGGTNPSSSANVSDPASTSDSVKDVTSTETSVIESKGGTSEEAKLVRSYIGTFEGGYYIPAYDMVQPGYDNYVVDLYDDNTYVSNKVIYMNMYGTQGSVVITTTGSYAIAENEDGDEIVSLSDAASILYTTCGMFAMQYSYNVKGIEDTVFPVSLMGSSSASDTFDFFQGEYGFGYSFLTNDTKCTIVELYLPESYAVHFAAKDEEGNLLPREESEVVNPYEGEVKAHDFGKDISHVYIGTFEGGYYIPAYDMVQPGYDNYVITTFEDGTFLNLNVKYMNMYGTLGSVTLRTEGTFTVEENEDGDEVISINEADSILYTTSGMFSMQYAWEVGAIENALFPVSLMGSSSASDTLELFKAEYGFAYSFLTNDAKCGITELTLPDEIADHFKEDEPVEKGDDDLSEEGQENE